MAIIKRMKRDGSASYQVKLRGSDNHFITQTFSTKTAAKVYEASVKVQKGRGQTVINQRRELSVNEYWDSWKNHSRLNVSNGWKMSQDQMFKSYISPVIGSLSLSAVSSVSIGKVLAKATELKRSAQTRRHIFNLLHKMFKDAVEDTQLIVKNPVLKKLKPQIPSKERKHLTPEQARTLLSVIPGERYEVAVWLGLVAGLRVGEIQALKWGDIDLNQGVLHVRGTYARKEQCFRDYPKGKRWHSVPLPKELHELLKREQPKAKNQYVVPGEATEFLHYDTYLKAVKGYCRKAGLEEISTHELRHSTAGIYLSFGATRDDLRTLFAHSSSKVTDGYIHGTNERLNGIANMIQLFPTVQGLTYAVTGEDCSQNVPMRVLKVVDSA